MPKAKIIDRIEFTRNRTKLLNNDADIHEQEIRNEHEVIVCPECGQELIHEAGCLRCFCGWSKC